MGPSTRDGFTMIELLVVMLIIAVIAFLMMPQFKKSGEVTRADEAVSTVQILGTTNRIYFLDKTVYAGCPSGSSGCSSYTASPLNTCSVQGRCDCAPTDTSGNPNPLFNCGNPCTLMWCGYMAPQDFSQAPYSYYALDGNSNNDPCGLSASGAPVGRYVACAKRNVCGVGGVTQNCVSSGSPYAAWGYTVDVNGTIQSWPTNGPSPAPPPT